MKKGNLSLISQFYYEVIVIVFYDVISAEQIIQLILGVIPGEYWGFFLNCNKLNIKFI